MTIETEIPLVFEYEGETVEIDQELRDALPLLGKFCWCVTLKEFPQLAQFCTLWHEMAACGSVWEDLMKARPELYSYVVATL